MRVLFVTYGTSEAPATRYRVEQYLPYLDRGGISYSCISMITSVLTRFLIRSSGTGGLTRLVWILCEQLLGFVRVSFRVARYDAVFFQRAVFPFGLEKLIRVLNKNIIYDLDDAIYTPVDHGKGALGRLKGLFKRSQVEGILKMSVHCICENGYIKSFVEKFCPRVSIITGPIDTKRNFVRGRREGTLTIGWVGSPATSRYLELIEGSLREVHKKFKFQFKVVGVKDYHIDGINVLSKDWTYSTEVEEIQSFDIGVCPMPDDTWTRGKVSVKILQYMANGVPTIVSYTSTNEEIIKDGVDGFVAHDDQEWVEKLSRIMTDADLRRKIGLQGRKTVEEKYSLDAGAGMLVKILKGTGQAF